MAKKYSMFPSAPSVSAADSVVGLHDGENSRFSFATILSFIQSLFVPTSRKINNKALSTDITLDASDVGAVGTADVGVADGVASLDSNGKVPGTQLDLSGKQNTITASGILKGDGTGGVSAATPGTDYAPADHASSATTYGKGDGSKYGHLKLSNSTNLNSGVVDGVAATPRAVKDTYDFAASKYTKPSGGIPASDLASGVIPSVPSAYTSNPAMDGTASPGSSGSWARGDHVHPSDTNKADANSYTGTFSGSSTAYVSSARVSDCKRSGMLVGLLLSLSLAAQIPLSRQTFGQLHGVPTPKTTAVGVMQIVDSLFAVTISTSGGLAIEAIGTVGGNSGWSGNVTIMYVTDGTIRP